jgi:hypothetical protein
MNQLLNRFHCSKNIRQSSTMTDTGRDGEIVGLKSGTSGRSCEAHFCCGASLHVGDLVRFRLVMLEVQGGAPFEALKVIKIKDGTEGCHVGFLPRYILKGARRNEFKDAFGQVILLYQDLTVKVLRRKNDRILGVASFRLLSDIQLSE